MTARIWTELPRQLLLALMTAVTTLILLIVVSTVLGAESNAHRVASRCFAHDTMALIREIVLASDSLRERVDLSKYPLIRVDGLDCDSVSEQLIDP